MYLPQIDLASHTFLLSAFAASPEGPRTLIPHCVFGVIFHFQKEEKSFRGNDLFRMIYFEQYKC